MRYASVCDGIGAAHVAWQPLGWQCQWTSEIEPFPVAVVDHRYGFRNLGDMTKITEEMLNEPVDLLVGGTPCQSFSVAGLRGGLADPRGNLALRFVQLASVMQPKWIVWENVPGVLSSGKGRDFGTFLGALAELGYGFAYRVLDAQWFGVAQRRRRVFVVGYLGDWRRAAAVLFERESVFGNPPTRGAKGEGITSSPQGIAGNVSSKWSKGTGGPAGGECYNLVAFHPTQDPISSQDGLVHALGTGSSGGCATAAVAYDILGTPATNAAKPTDVHVPLRARLPGQSEASTTTVVAIPINADADRRNSSASTPSPDAEGRVRLRDPGIGIDYRIAWIVSERGQCRGEDGQPMFTMQATKPHAVAIDLQNVTAGGDLAGTLDTTRPSRGGGQAVAFDTYNQTLNQTVRAGASEQAHEQVGAVFNGMAVRRLTPRECERLQGFPDDYTLVTYRGKPAADGPRYRALGNSMAVPVMRWIGERIAAAGYNDATSTR